MCLQELGVVQIIGSELPMALFLGADYPAQLTEGQGEVEHNPVVLGPLRVLPAPGTSTPLLVEA